jgi:hypothetical protein
MYSAIPQLGLGPKAPQPKYLVLSEEKSETPAFNRERSKDNFFVTIRNMARKAAILRYRLDVSH